MKKHSTILILILLANLAYADTESALARVDRLRARLTEIEARKHTDREAEDIYRELVSVAYADLMEHTESVFTKGKGVDHRWVTRLENLPLSPDESVLRDKNASEFTKGAVIFADEAKPPLGSHLLQRCWIDRVLAVYFSRKGDLDTAERYINASTSYLDLMNQCMAEQITKLKLASFIRKTQDENREFLRAIQAKQKTRLEVAQSSGNKGGATTAQSNTATQSKKSAATTKTFTVTSDARANQTGDEAGARGESSITVRGDDGTFTVRYSYDWPSSYLISAGRGKTLEGKSVSIQFDAEKATYISCGAGGGKCQIKSFSRQ